MVMSTHVVNLDDIDGSESASGVRIILDKKMNINADGTEKTEFYSGDTANMLVILPPALSFVRAGVTDPGGDVTEGGFVDRLQTDRLFFLMTGKKMSLSQVPLKKASAVWYGRDGDLQQSGAEAWVNQAPAVGDITYYYRALSLKVVIPKGLVLGKDDKYPFGLVVYVKGVADGN